jgi:hypothetical protein
MAKHPKQQNHETDIHSDAWERFERAVDAAVKSGPKHRQKHKDAEAGSSKTRAARPRDPR